MASAALCRIFELNTGVPTRIVDETVAVYWIVKRREIPLTNAFMKTDTTPERSYKYKIFYKIKSKPL